MFPSQRLSFLVLFVFVMETSESFWNPQEEKTKA